MTGRNTRRPGLAHARRRIAQTTGILGALAVSGLCALSAPPVLAQDTAQNNAQAPRVPQSVGLTAADSGAPVWPEQTRAPAGAPNVLLILTDDVGFGTTSTFGGPVPTPTFDALAQQGLRYNQFNTTALCSPTRASLLTGRNPHNVNVGNVTNIPTGYEGYTSNIPDSAGTVARILSDGGFATAMFGKSHLTPEWEMGPAGPFDRWPTGLGFDHFYGFLSADTNQFAPNLVEDRRHIDYPRDDPDYILDHDLADKAIAWIDREKATTPDKPFFMYYAPGTAHTPHQAPKEWLEKFRGKFDMGWDKLREQTFARQKRMGVIPANAQLTPRPEGLPAWDSLSADKKRLYTRLIEAYAAAIAYSDHEIGRIVDALKASGEYDNTLIIFIQGDNGSSAEGGPNGTLFEQSMINRYDEPLDYMLSRIDEIGGPNLYNHFPAGFAWGMDSPFQWYKQVASHFGGVRNGLVMSWPKGITHDGRMREQFHYVTDIAPTILEATGIAAPASIDGVEQKPLDGISMAYTFDKADAPGERHTQVFEMMENMGIYHDGWWAGTSPSRAAWDVARNIKTDVMARNWELYDLTSDYSQSKDLAKAKPEKLRAMQGLFWAEAAKNHILPIHDFSEGAQGRPTATGGATHFVYRSPMTHIVESAAPPTIGKSWRIAADVELPQTPAQGVLVTQGGRFGGYAFYLENGRPVFHYNAIGERQYRIASSEALSPGEHDIVARFAADSNERGGPGTLTISVDGREVAQGRIEATMFGWVSHTEGFDVGSDTITPVADTYTIENSTFTGTFKTITFDVSDPE
ncbi:arylsulfatase [Novosphingobium sp. YJ-S2-02]|uniref:Arylsulfatase n=1 Tax=Novosphingobium aureum TaxID=2792964 RepID=A0A931HF20_9SPHN|nr:arylsulfatase [Novosphingobium aureum]MBH0114589.1 arylsulfatase [Novosphingobium aureum]